MKHLKIIRIISIVMAAILVVVGGWFAWRMFGQVPEETGYAPYPHDTQAVSASTLPAELPTLNAGEFMVSLNPELTVAADGRCALNFVNPASNPCHLMMDIRLTESNLLIYRTGLVNPGEGIGEIAFVKDAVDAMASGAQDVMLTVYTFKVGTYENLGDVNLGARLVCEKG